MALIKSSICWSIFWIAEKYSCRTALKWLQNSTNNDGYISCLFTDTNNGRSILPTILLGKELICQIHSRFSISWVSGPLLCWQWPSRCGSSAVTVTHQLFQAPRLCTNCLLAVLDTRCIVASMMEFLLVVICWQKVLCLIMSLWDNETWLP